MQQQQQLLPPQTQQHAALPQQTEQALNAYNAWTWAQQQQLQKQVQQLQPQQQKQQQMQQRPVQQSIEAPQMSLSDQLGQLQQSGRMQGVMPAVHQTGHYQVPNRN